MHAFVCKYHEVSDTLFTLYDGDTMKAITENFCVKWGRFGMPLNADQCDVLFTDLSSVDWSARKIYLICQVVRWGGMDAKEPDAKHLASMKRKQSQNSIQSATAAALSADGSSSASGAGQMRRPFGVAFYDLTPVLKSGGAGGAEATAVFPMALDMPFVQCEKESFDATLRKLIQSSGDKGRIDSKLAISVDLINGETKQVRGFDSFAQVFQRIVAGVDQLVAAFMYAKGASCASC